MMKPVQVVGLPLSQIRHSFAFLGICPCWLWESASTGGHNRSQLGDADGVALGVVHEPPRAGRNLPGDDRKTESRIDTV